MKNLIAFYLILIIVFANCEKSSKNEKHQNFKSCIKVNEKVPKTLCKPIVKKKSIALFRGDSVYSHEFQSKDYLELDEWPINPKIEYKEKTYNTLNDLLAQIDSNQNITIPFGIYTYPVACKNKKNINFNANEGPVLFVVPDDSINIFEVEFCNNITIEGLYFRFNTYTYGYESLGCGNYGKLGESCINVRNSSNIIIRHCYLARGSENCFRAENTNGIYVDDVIADESRSNGIYIAKSTNIVITKSSIHSPLITIQNKDSLQVQTVDDFTKMYPKDTTLFSFWKKNNSTETNFILINNSIKDLGKYGVNPESIFTGNGLLYKNYISKSWISTFSEAKKISSSGYIDHSRNIEKNWRPKNEFFFARIEHLNLYAPSYWKTLIYQNGTRHNSKPKKKYLNVDHNVDIIYPGVYYYERKNGIDTLDGKYIHAVQGDSIIKTQVHWKYLRKESGFDEDSVKVFELISDDSIDFIVTGVEIGKMDKVNFVSQNRGSYISCHGVMGENQLRITAVNSDFYAALWVSQNGKKDTYFDYAGITFFDIEGYSVNGVNWIGDLNSDGKIDFKVSVNSSLFDTDEYLFLSHDDDFNVINIKDKMWEPRGC